MSENYSEEIKVRVPQRIKDAFSKLAKSKIKKEAELAREAFARYLQEESGFHEESPAYLSSSEKVDEAVEKAVEMIADAAKKEAAQAASKKYPAHRAKVKKPSL